MGFAKIAAQKQNNSTRTTLNGHIYNLLLYFIENVEIFFILQKITKKRHLVTSTKVYLSGNVKNDD